MQLQTQAALINCLKIKGKYLNEREHYLQFLVLYLMLCFKRFQDSGIDADLQECRAQHVYAFSRVGSEAKGKFLLINY